MASIEALVQDPSLRGLYFVGYHAPDVNTKNGLESGVGVVARKMATDGVYMIYRPRTPAVHRYALAYIASLLVSKVPDERSNTRADDLLQFVMIERGSEAWLTPVAVASFYTAACSDASVLVHSDALEIATPSQPPMSDMQLSRFNAQMQFSLGAHEISDTEVATERLLGDAYDRDELAGAAGDRLVLISKGPLERMRVACCEPPGDRRPESIRSYSAWLPRWMSDDWARLVGVMSPYNSIEEMSVRMFECAKLLNKDDVKIDKEIDAISAQMTRAAFARSGDGASTHETTAKVHAWLATRGTSAWGEQLVASPQLAVPTPMPSSDDSSWARARAHSITHGGAAHLHGAQSSRMVTDEDDDEELPIDWCRLRTTAMSTSTNDALYIRYDASLAADSSRADGRPVESKGTGKVFVHVEAKGQDIRGMRDIRDMLKQVAEHHGCTLVRLPLQQQRTAAPSVAHFAVVVQWCGKHELNGAASIIDIITRTGSSPRVFLVLVFDADAVQDDATFRKKYKNIVQYAAILNRGLARAKKSVVIFAMFYQYKLNRGFRDDSTDAVLSIHNQAAIESMWQYMRHTV
jgi:hypothetical protein